jgi:serine/threonine protein kinase
VVAAEAAPAEGAGASHRSSSSTPELTTLVAGTRVGNYELLAHIGAGAMGEVWRARDTELQRDVAIKVVPKDLMDRKTLYQQRHAEWVGSRWRGP